MSKIRKVIAGMLVCCYALLLTSCTGGDSSAPPSGPAQSSSASAASAEQNDEEQITLRYMTWNTTEVTLQGAYERFKSEYEALHPNITIEYVDIPYGNMVQQAFTYAAAGDLPDIVEMATPFIATFTTSNILQPLDGLVDQELLDDLQPVTLSEVTNDGKIMAMPRIIIPQVLYYNKTLFEQAGLDPESPPQTYEEMMEYAREIAKLTTDAGENIYGLGEGLAQQSNNGLFSMRNFIGFGCEFEAEDGVLQVDEEAGVATLDYYRTLVDENLCPEGALPKDLRNLFATGRLGMYFDVSNQSATLNAIAANGDAFEEEYGKAVVPVNVNGVSNTTSNTASIGISATTEHAEEAAQFIEWLMSKEAYQIYFDENNTVMTTRISLSDDPLFTEGKDGAVLTQQYPDGMVNLPPAQSYMEQFYVELTKAISSATQTDDSLESIVAALNESIRSLV